MYYTTTSWIQPYSWPVLRWFFTHFNPVSRTATGHPLHWKPWQKALLFVSRGRNENRVTCKSNGFQKWHKPKCKKCKHKIVADLPLHQFPSIKDNEMKCGKMCVVKRNEGGQRQYWPGKYNIVSQENFLKNRFKTNRGKEEVNFVSSQRKLWGSCRSWFNEPGIKPFPTCKSPHLQAWNSRAERQGDLPLNSAAACPGTCCVLLHLYEVHSTSRQRTPRSTGFPPAGVYSGMSLIGGTAVDHRTAWRSVFSLRTNVHQSFPSVRCCCKGKMQSTSKWGELEIGTPARLCLRCGVSLFSTAG